MNSGSGFIHPVKTTASLGVAVGDMVAVIGKLLSGGEARGFSDNAVAFDDDPVAIGMGDYPFATQQRDRAVGAVTDGHEINKRVRLVRGQALTAMVIHHFVEAGGQAGELNGSSHDEKRCHSKRTECGFATVRMR